MVVSDIICVIISELNNQTIMKEIIDKSLFGLTKSVINFQFVRLTSAGNIYIGRVLILFESTFSYNFVHWISRSDLA